ncbi:MAG: hypothetical protein F9K24_18200 [Leptonema illini]|uniref:Uncharacterized protein n=1 Tax=Leptonema illini TaxID=183 RepID=A0A833GYM4_9LEPT|nr:MAG: hypothetical protein F9K24_18200 [Leptonema illini]
MNLKDDLKNLITLLQDVPSLAAEQEFEPLFKNLEKSVRSINEKARHYSGVNWPILIELRASLKAINSKHLARVNDRLERFGLRIPSQPKQRAEFTVQCARRSDAQEILKEIRKKPEDILREEYYSLVRLSSASAEAHLANMSDAELSAFVKRHKIPLKKRREGKKTVLDRNSTINDILLRLEKERLATQA